ncbi:hypothetical protein LOAG_15757 [Loa loa]|uniref:Uncharacterized protein n=1 Tax=Loa loa TaxID=7209 RepID=A0A1S0TG85_LOALO|nr:hypothetical protein LOAG_15757 [Loa loa]EFO12778.1 hypothetical protein LOAG_15757 [Loa loa]
MCYTPPMRNIIQNLRGPDNSVVEIDDNMRWPLEERWREKSNRYVLLKLPSCATAFASPAPPLHVVCKRKKNRSLQKLVKILQNLIVSHAFYKAVTASYVLGEEAT